MGAVLEIRCILAVVGYVAAIVHRPLPSLFVMLLFYDCMFHAHPLSQVNVDDGVDVIVTLLFSVGSCGMEVPLAGSGNSWAKLIDVWWHWVSMVGQVGTLDMCIYLYSVYQRSLSKVLGWIQRKWLGVCANFTLGGGQHTMIWATCFQRIACLCYDLLFSVIRFDHDSVIYVHRRIMIESNN